MNTIQLPNSSGQGFCQLHESAANHWVAVKFGYTYSHSTPITRQDGSTYLLHTYRHGEHTLSFSTTGCQWTTSVSTASGRCCQGERQDALIRHLASKRRRYAELR